MGIYSQCQIRPIKENLGPLAKLPSGWECCRAYDVSRDESQHFLSCTVYHMLAILLSPDSINFFCNSLIVNILFFLFLNDFYFVHYSWFRVFCQFSTVQQRDPVTHTYIHSFSHTTAVITDCRSGHGPRSLGVHEQAPLAAPVTSQGIAEEGISTEHHLLSPSLSCELTHPATATARQ